MVDYQNVLFAYNLMDEFQLIKKVILIKRSLPKSIQKISIVYMESIIFNIAYIVLSPVIDNGFFRSVIFGHIW